MDIYEKKYLKYKKKYLNLKQFGSSGEAESAKTMKSEEPAKSAKSAKPVDPVEPAESAEPIDVVKFGTYQEQYLGVKFNGNIYYVDGLEIKTNETHADDPELFISKNIKDLKEDEKVKYGELLLHIKKNTKYDKNIKSIELYLELSQTKGIDGLSIIEIIKKKKKKQFSFNDSKDSNIFNIEHYKEYIKKIFKNLIDEEISDEEISDEDKFYIKELFEILTPHYNLFFDWFDYLEKMPNFENLEENNNMKKLEKIYEENYMKKLKKIYFEDNPSNLYFDLLELSIEKSKDLENISDAGDIIYNYFKEIAIDPSIITNSQIIEIIKKIENRHKFIDDVFEGGICEFFKLDLIANTIKQDEDEINNLKEEEERRINALIIDDATKEKIKEEIKKKYPYPYPLFHRDNNLIYQYDYDKLIKEGVKLDQLEKCLNDNFISEKIKKSIYKERILKKLIDEIEKLDDHTEKKEYIEAIRDKDVKYILYGKMLKPLIEDTKKKEYIEAIRDEEVKKELYKKLYDDKSCETKKNKPKKRMSITGRTERIKEENRKLKFKDDESKLEITLKNKIKKHGEYFIIKGENFCMLKNGHFFEKIDEGKDLFGEDKEILESKNKVVTAVYLFLKFDLIDSVEKVEQFKQYLIDNDFTNFTEIKDKVEKYLPTSPP